MVGSRADFLPREPAAGRAEFRGGRWYEGFSVAR